ncbi:MAG TPA: type II toxin-antitoxin system prevent-host-death family antitoxin [Thermoanaerobaculia bacterium]|nr:type II toxin-antitoxin system prevent-host-death family antitoxin [Thermoanaerobaculia bacterium]
MAIQTTYTNARANLSKLCDEVTENREIVIISRRGAEDVALVAASELASLTETAHLLRSPNNAARLLKALDRARAGTEQPQTVEELRRELGLGEEKQ